MTFAEFLLRTELHHTVVAQAMGVSPEALRRYRSGDRLPIWPVLVRLAELSKGDCMPNDFLNLAKERVQVRVAAHWRGKRGKAKSRTKRLPIAAE
jgi:hypothetical protein